MSGTDSDAADLLERAARLLEEGRPEETEALARQALATHADGQAFLTLAAALVAQSRYEEAVPFYDEALASDSESAEANFGLGIALHNLERYEEAIACFARALALDTDYPEAECAMAASLQAMRRYDEAAVHYQRSIDIDPEFLAPRHGLGTVFQALGRYDDAVACYRSVLALAPDERDTLQQLGVALQALLRHDEALVVLQRAISIEANARTHLLLGTAYQEIGKSEQAEASIRRALALDPREMMAYLVLFTGMRATPDDPALAAARQIAIEHMDELSADQRMKLHLALGRALSGIGDSQGGFENFVAGNALKRRTVLYDEPAVLSALERTAQIFAPALLSQLGGGGHSSSVPIFIVGMPRSGSTLVEQILASHPAVAGGGERGELGRAVEEVCGGKGAVRFPELAVNLRQDMLRRIGARYVDLLRASVPDAASHAHITDKRLENYCLIGLIHLALPEARIVHISRDPIDTCLSCFSSTLADVPFSTDLGELGRYYAGYHRLMAHWRNVLPADAFLDMRYEELVDDFEAQVRRLLAYCRLEWNDACRTFHENSRPVRTASMTQVRQPLYRSSLRRWRPDDGAMSPLLAGLGDLVSNRH